MDSQEAGRQAHSHTASVGTFPQEFRAGLVMYGGVSLAIYIYGVALEFWEAVRGRGVYGPLKEMLETDIVVDIVSGTSAGGVNGVLLGRALATGGDFGAVAELWRDWGDVLAMLQDPLGGFEGGGKGVPEALFRSRAAYEDKLRKALVALGSPVESKGEVVSPLSELDVFVTGTNFYGRTSHSFRIRPSS